MVDVSVAGNNKETVDDSDVLFDNEMFLAYWTLNTEEGSHDAGVAVNAALHQNKDRKIIEKMSQQV